MLLRFRVANHRSLRDEQELSFVASTTGDPDSALIPCPELDLDVVPVAGIYGANASGKSNVLSALQFMKDAVTGSYREWRPDETAPVSPFQLDPASRSGLSLYEVDLFLDGVRYTYGFEIEMEGIRREWLNAFPNGRKQAWLDREGEDFGFGKNLKGNNRTIAALTRANSLFLSVAASNNHTVLLPIYSWFATKLRFRDVPRGNIGVTLSMLSEDKAATILDLLKRADIGIVGVDVREDQGKFYDFWPDEDIQERASSLTVRLKHQGAADTEAFLPFDEESLGTKCWFALAGPVLRTLRLGGFLCIDELDASLHPLLAGLVIQLFQNSETNPNHAQLLFNSHDTTFLGNLLGAPILLRDQIWFVEKDDEGASHLYALTDFKPRKEENLERGYLQGRYGAIPFVEKSEALKRG